LRAAAVTSQKRWAGTPDEFAAFLKTNFELWDKVIKEQRIALD